MLKQLFPKLHQRYLSSPLLEPILDGYDDWLSERKYTRKTRRFYMRMALLVDQYLQELGLENLSDISADIMQSLWVQGSSIRPINVIPHPEALHNICGYI